MSKLMTYILSHNDAIQSTFQLQIQTLMNKNPSPFTQLAPCILQNLKSKFLNYDGTPFCFVEISHRSRFYDNLNNLAVDVIKKYFNAEQYEVVFMPPGSAMSTIYFNFVEPDTKIVFHCGGSFSDRYYQQMRKYHDKVAKAQKLQDIKPSLISHTTCPQIIHYNKIDEGIEISPQLIKQQIPEQNIKNSIIVNNISYSFPWTQIQPINEDILYFESQSGFSIPGFTVMLVKKQLMANMKVRENCPDMFDLLMMIKMKSVVNTPFTLCTLVLYENIKYALENKAKIVEDVTLAKKQYTRMLIRAGFRLLENQNEGKQKEKEAFNFIRAYYGMREEKVLENIESMGWINKQNQSICIFLQSPNSSQPPQYPPKPENEIKAQ